MDLKIFIRVLSIHVAFLSSIFAIYWSRSNSVKTQERTNFLKQPALFVGILSSPDHFRERQSLRDTWLQEHPGNFNYRFLIGKKLCGVHPLDRTSQYKCEKWNITNGKTDNSKTLIHATSDGYYAPEENIETVIGFNFYVHHPIQVEFIGVKSKLSLEQDILYNIVLLNSSATKLVSVVFDGDSIVEDIHNQGYILKRLSEPVVLPRGFEGSLKITSSTGSEFDIVCNHTTNWTHRNFLTVYRRVKSNMTKMATSSCVLPTFSFSIKEERMLNDHLDGITKREVEWSAHNIKLHKMLQDENNNYNDVLFLDLVDVYHNLPQKVYLFLEWVYKNYNIDYVLKTDDDTFIDIRTVKLELEKVGDWDWWSCFRVNWPVQQYGRHRELAYMKKTYPTFPAGAGYVLSRKALTWLNQRFETPPTFYQGEDVSMGIWLEDFRPRNHVGIECYWACNEHCHTRSCNSMQLSVEQMYQMWTDYKNCGGKICSCPL